MEEYQDHSLGSRVFQKIRDNILNGTYKENDELRETAIGKELGVSRTPVREALRQLELEGLVTIIPNRGAYVSGISHKDIWDIYKIRSMLEGLCARWAAEHITEEQLDQLEESLLLSEFQMKKESGFSTEQVAALDGRFHAVLYEASGSRMLKHVLTDFIIMCKEPENHRSYQKKEPESRYVNTDRFYVRSKTEMQRWQNSLLMSILFM